MEPLTCAELREVDRRAAEEFGLPGVVLMENAGAGAARIALAMLAERAGERPGTAVDPRVNARPEARVVPQVDARPEVLVDLRVNAQVCCGPGNNGGDGWVVARHLANQGVDVFVTAFAPLDALRGDAAVHARVALRMGIAHAEALDDAALATARARWRAADLVVDALLGTGASGAPRGRIGAAIAVLAALDAEPGGRAPSVLALDVPSGFDADTGARPGPCVRADATATFAAPKSGFAAPGAAEWLGRVHVVDIGVPRSLLVPRR